MKNLKVGLQLYTVAEAMNADMDAALKRVKEIGYDYVEFAGYFDKSPEEIKAMLDKYGLTAISVHRGLPFFLEDEERELAYLKTLGVKFSAIPHYAEAEYHENWEETMAAFEKLGRMLRENGIQLLYHNHDFEFKKIGDAIILDKMYAEIPDGLIKPEIDTCWAHYAGTDPALYLKKYAGQIEVVHLKDFSCDKFGAGPVYDLIDSEKTDSSPAGRDAQGFKFRAIGEGIQDWKGILEVCVACGTEYVIVEQDRSYDEDAMDCAQRSRQYLKENFGI